jgi:hypothetical protein
LLVALGGVNRASDRLADVELALDLRELDLRTVIEPAARIVEITDPLAASHDSAFTSGRIAERLFWRSAAYVGLPLSLALHPLAVLSNPAGLLGRLVALLEIGSTNRHRTRLAQAAARLSEIRAEERETLPLPAAPAIKMARRRAA